MPPPSIQFYDQSFRGGTSLGFASYFVSDLDRLTEAIGVKPGQTVRDYRCQAVGQAVRDYRCQAVGRLSETISVKPLDSHRLYCTEVSGRWTGCQRLCVSEST